MTDILAYADRVSLRPGETIGFKVSLIGASRFDVAVKRLVAPNFGHSEHLPPVAEIDAPSAIEGSHAGRRQALRAGSYIALDKGPDLDGAPGVTLSAFIYPTLPKAARRQVILGDYGQDAGVSLAVEGGELQLLSGGEERPLAIGRLQRHRWYHVAVSVDFATGRVAARCELAPRQGLEAPPAVELTTERKPPPPGGRFAIAAGFDAGDGPIWHFNGKIERPRVFARALDLPAMAAMAKAGSQAPPASDAAADWDFSKGIAGDMVTDVSGHGCHGRTVQSPARAVFGAAWTGEVLDWRAAPGQYGAIHFHETDMADAGWETTLSLTVPDDWPSACYSLKLTADGAEWRVPFFVAPKPQARRKVALLMPTATYAAYANHRYRFTAPWHEATQGRLVSVDATDLLILKYPEIGRSSYDTHSDGSSVHYSTLRRPIVNFRPSGRPYKFALDLLIVAWLEHEKVAFDVITDDDLHREGRALLDGYDVVISGSHPEYWSGRMIDALSGYLTDGGRFMCLGGNSLFFTVDLHPEHQGFAEVRRMLPGVYGYYGAGDARHRWSGEQGGVWTLLGRSPHLYVGLGATIQGNDVCAGYRRAAGSNDPRAAFIFDGVDDEVVGDFGVLTGGAAGFEIDRADHVLGTPSHALVVASSFDHSTNFESDMPEKAFMAALADSPTAEPIRADMVFFETPGGGAVFAVGSIAYCGSLSWNGYDNNLARLTGNVLRRFTDPRPFEGPV